MREIWKFSEFGNFEKSWNLGRKDVYQKSRHSNNVLSSLESLARDMIGFKLVPHHLNRIEITIHAIEAIAVLRGQFHFA